MENIKDNPTNKGQKHSRGMFKRKLGGKDGMQRVSSFPNTFQMYLLVFLLS